MEKKYLILGLGLSGKAACLFLLNQNKKILALEDFIDDDDAEIKILKKQNVEIFKTKDIDNEKILDFKKIEKVIISPGFNPKHKIVELAKKNKLEIISEIELGIRYLKKLKNFQNKIIGITGTNGKTTLTLLLAHILYVNKKNAKTLGNIKIPLTSYLLKPDPKDILILELSSFQLENLKTKFLDLAVITNITPDHLDRYPTFLHYAKTKLSIIKCLNVGKNLYTTKKVLKSFVVKNKKTNIKEVKEDIIDIAIKICLDLKIAKKNILDAIKTFKTEKHRLEFVREIKDIYFYNDSKATNVDAVIYAVKKIKGPIILIVGGMDKGFSYKIWKKTFIGKVKYILAIGNSAKKIKNELTGLKVEIVRELKEAVQKAYSLAKTEDRVLLSPGCSSFDQFKNFEQRGEKFKEIVSLLGEK